MPAILFYSACRFHFERDWKAWRNARQFSRTENVTECPPFFLLCLHIPFRQTLKNMTECSPIFWNDFFLFFVGISFPGASRAAVEDQMGSQVDLLIFFRTPLRKWTSPLCENPIIYYVFEVAFCENPIIYYVLSTSRIEFFLKSDENAAPAMLLEPPEKPVLAREREARLFFKKCSTMFRKVTLKAPKVMPRTPKAPQSDPPGAQSVPKVSQSHPKVVSSGPPRPPQTP